MHTPVQKVSSDSDSEDSVKEMIEDDDSEAEDELSILQRQKNKKLLELRKNEKKTRQKEENEEKSKKKETVCPHLKKGRCNYGLSGRKHNNNITNHDEKSCREKNLCECPYAHPLVCGKLLRKGTGRNGCKSDQNCKKLHPKICPNSLKGVCHTNGCKLGIHIQGTNTKEAREKDKKEEMGERVEKRRDVLPTLPFPQQPKHLPRVLGQERPQPSSWAKVASSPPAAVPGIAGETASFLEQLLLGELLKRMQQKVTPPTAAATTKVKSQQEVPSVSLEMLLRALSQPQQN